jgi:hypothetical protein
MADSRAGCGQAVPVRKCEPPSRRRVECEGEYSHRAAVLGGKFGGAATAGRDQNWFAEVGGRLTGRLLTGTETAPLGSGQSSSTSQSQKRVAAGLTHAFRLSKCLTHRINEKGLSFDAVPAAEAEAQGEASRTPDFTEGITAFQSKREPSFTGGSA